MIQKRKRIGFPVTLTEDTKTAFDQFCVDRQINRSRLVEWILVEYLNKDKNECNNRK